MTKQERLEGYYNRLWGQPLSTTVEGALDRLEQTLLEVEDDLSGIPRSDPPPPPNAPDGRMYPPQADSIVRRADGSITANTRKQAVLIGADGSIKITTRQTGRID